MQSEALLTPDTPKNKLKRVAPLGEPTFSRFSGISAAGFNRQLRKTNIDALLFLYRTVLYIDLDVPIPRPAPQTLRVCEDAGE